MNTNVIGTIGGYVIQLAALCFLGALALTHDGTTLEVIVPVLSAIAGGSLVSTSHVLMARAARPPATPAEPSAGK